MDGGDEGFLFTGEEQVFSNLSISPTNCKKKGSFSKIKISREEMASSSKKWARKISSIASLVYFLVIIFQIPLFRVSCRIGTCTTPIEVTSSQLIASEILPAEVVKPLLYPGAIAQAMFKNTIIPTYGDLLNFYNFTKIIKQHPATIDLQHLEILAGSYLSVVGAILGILKPGRMSLFGTLLIIWGLNKEVILRKSAKLHSPKSLSIYPTMLIALFSAFLSIKSDIRKIIRSCRARRGVKRWPKYLKTKQK